MATILFLALGIGIVLLSCVGLLVMPGVFNRLHYIGPATTLAPIAIALAVLCNEAFSPSGIKALLIAIILFLISPVITHATARAAYIREFGDLQPHDKSNDVSTVIEESQRK